MIKYKPLISEYKKSKAIPLYSNPALSPKEKKHLDKIINGMTISNKKRIKEGELKDIIKILYKIKLPFMKLENWFYITHINANIWYEEDRELVLTLQGQGENYVVISKVNEISVSKHNGKKGFPFSKTIQNTKYIIAKDSFDL